VWIATGHTDMRCGMSSLALLVQEAFRRDPHSGDLYVFRGKSGKLIKILWHDGQRGYSRPVSAVADALEPWGFKNTSYQNNRQVTACDFPPVRVGCLTLPIIAKGSWVRW
jgi:IS66 Orf2 like protein